MMKSIDFFFNGSDIHSSGSYVCDELGPGGEVAADECVALDGELLLHKRDNVVVGEVLRCNYEMKRNGPV